MKNNLIYVAAMAAVAALGACTGKQAALPADADGDGTDKVYTGVLPSADAAGVRYTVLLDYDDDGNGGDYDMVQTYFTTDSVGNIVDIASFAEDGDFTVGTENGGKKYLKFTGDGASEVFFLVDTDSTIVMTDASLVPSTTPGLNYTLKSAR